MPSPLAALLLFEAINGSNELTAETSFITGKLNADLAALNGFGGNQSQQLAYLTTSFRFRGYFHSDFYVPFYTQLKTSLDSWFTGHASSLGGTGSPVFTALRNNYAIVNTGPSVVHDFMVNHGNLQQSLSVIP
jgi:hypothetical protein